MFYFGRLGEKLFFLWISEKGSIGWGDEFLVRRIRRDMRADFLVEQWTSNFTTHLFVLGLDSPPPGSPYIFDSRREGEKKEPNSEGFLGHPALFTYQGNGKARH
jgi:hypothetical protein